MQSSCAIFGRTTCTAHTAAVGSVTTLIQCGTRTCRPFVLGNVEIGILGVPPLVLSPEPACILNHLLAKPFLTMSEIVGLLSPSAESQHDDESQHDEKEEYQLRTQSYSKHKSRMVSYLLLGMGIASLITNIIQFRLGIQARQAADACKLPLSTKTPNGLSSIC